MNPEKRQHLLRLLRSNKGMTLVEVMVVIAMISTEEPSYLSLSLLTYTFSSHFVIT